MRSWWLLPTSVILFAITIGIGFLAKSSGASGPDLAVDVDLAEARNGLLTVLALTVNYVLSPAGNVIILAVICLALMFVLRRPLSALAFGSTAAIGWLSSEVGKIAVARLRPPSDLTHALVMETGHNSFPSGHTAFAASLAWAACLVLARTDLQRRLTAVVGILFAAAVALSRLYLGVHYPTDVIGSLLISSAGIMLWLPLWNHIAEPWLRRLPLTTRLSVRNEPERSSSR